MPLCAPGWAQLGLPVEQLLLVQPRASVRGAARERLPHADVLWALEQALKSGHVGAVLAWLPARLRAEVLRRLQLAAHAHDGPAFLLRELSAQARPSPAPLRLLLQPGGVDALSLRVLKRRGPALPDAVQLALPPVLPVVVRSRAEPSADEQVVLPPLPQAPQPSSLPF
jgi:protein ImuA